MRSSAQGTAVRLRLGAILSLLMLLCAFAPSARAGCSAHYLAVRTQAAPGISTLDPLILSESMLSPDDTLPPSRPKPCSGALCSGNPAAPTSTAPSVLAEGDGHWALSPLPSVLADLGSTVRSAEDARLVPLDHPSPIFHPPRLTGPHPAT